MRHSLEGFFACDALVISVVEVTSSGIVPDALSKLAWVREFGANGAGVASLRFNA